MQEPISLLEELVGNYLISLELHDMQEYRIYTRSILNTSGAAGSFQSTYSSVIAAKLFVSTCDKQVALENIIRKSRTTRIDRGT